MTDRYYSLCVLLQYQLRLYLNEWSSARELATRLGRPVDELNKAHCIGVQKLLGEHVSAIAAESAE